VVKFLVFYWLICAHSCVAEIVYIGWVERLFAKPIIPHEVDGLI